MKTILKDNEYYISLKLNDLGQYYVNYPYGQWSETSKNSKVSSVDAQEVINKARSLYELVLKVQNGTWPMSKEEKKKYYEEQGINDLLAKIKKEATENYNLGERR